jgi:hypothetical protein
MVKREGSSPPLIGLERAGNDDPPRPGRMAPLPLANNMQPALERTSRVGSNQALVTPLHGNVAQDRLHAAIPCKAAIIFLVYMQRWDTTNRVWVDWSSDCQAELLPTPCMIG